MAQSAGGPRAGSLPPDEIDRYENLILLCRNHHRVVDEQEAAYTIARLRDIKRAHEMEVRSRLDWMRVPIPEPAYPDPTSEPDALPRYVRSNELFAERLGDAFPGTRGLLEITDPVGALDRLDVVFRPPIHQSFIETDGGNRRVYPFWWFRGGINLHIESYRRLTPDICLLDYQELQITRIATFRTLGSSLRDFLYLEAAGMPPSGAYSYKDGEIESRKGRSGGDFAYEEYAVWNGRAITREEYDDRAAVIDGRPIRINGAELRLRYLTPFNLLLCGNRHVINEPKYDGTVTRLMDGLLRRERTLSDLSSHVMDLAVPERLQFDDWE